MVLLSSAAFRCGGPRVLLKCSKSVGRQINKASHTLPWHTMPVVNICAHSNQLPTRQHGLQAELNVGELCSRRNMQAVGPVTCWEDM